MNDWLPAVAAGVAAVATIVVAAITGRSALAAQRVQAQQAREASAAAARTDEGRLALAIALETRQEHRETRGRLDAHEDWREELVNSWLPDHEARDRAVERELARLDPSFTPPPWKPLPRLKRYVPAGDDTPA